jgi:hypothetical protein
MRYYTLAVPGAPSVRLPGPLEVGPFGSDPPYATARLAYRTSPWRLDYYVYHRWAGDPRTLVANAVRDYLGPAAATSGPPLVVTGHLRRLEERELDGRREAAVALDLTVRQDARVRLSGSWAETEPIEDRGPEAAVAALSRALGRLLDQVAAALAGGMGGAQIPSQRQSRREPGVTTSSSSRSARTLASAASVRARCAGLCTYASRSTARGMP